jgi:hypothetical protein
VLPDWLQEIAALTTLALASVWLVWRWLAIGKPRAQPGCARCEHNPQAADRPSLGGASTRASVGVRSARSTGPRRALGLRVLDS